MSGQAIQIAAQAGQRKKPAMDYVSMMLNVFVDPATTAKKVRSDYSWLWPMLVIATIVIVVGMMMMPYTLQLIDARMAHAGSTENTEQARNVATTVARVGIVTGPIFMIGMMAFVSWLISGIVTALGSNVRFRDVFGLVSCCGLIPTLRYIAGYIVVRARGEQIESIDQLRPPFGLDIFLPDLHGPALAFVGFFSIFEIWYLVALTVGLAYLTRSSKAKAFSAITPAWLIPLLLSVISVSLQK
jgi:Yip1 domain